MQQRRVVAYATNPGKIENLQIVHIFTSILPPVQPLGEAFSPLPPRAVPPRITKCAHRYVVTHARIVGSCYAVTHNDRNILAKTRQVHYTIDVVLHIRSCVHGAILTCSQGVGGYQPSIPAARYSRGVIVPQFFQNCKCFNKVCGICRFCINSAFSSPEKSICSPSSCKIPSVFPSQKDTPVPGAGPPLSQAA